MTKYDKDALDREYVDRVLTRKHAVVASPITAVYGDNPCCADSRAFKVTRTNATGTSIFLACPSHVDEASAYQAAYVPGWGTITVTIERA